jgi:hypothetical protein
MKIGTGTRGANSLFWTNRGALRRRRLRLCSKIKKREVRAARPIFMKLSAKERRPWPLLPKSSKKRRKPNRRKRRNGCRSRRSSKKAASNLNIKLR